MNDKTPQYICFYVYSTAFLYLDFTTQTILHKAIQGEKEIKTKGHVGAAST